MIRASNSLFELRRFLGSQTDRGKLPSAAGENATPNRSREREKTQNDDPHFSSAQSSSQRFPQLFFDSAASAAVVVTKPDERVRTDGQRDTEKEREAHLRATKPCGRSSDRRRKPSTSYGGMRPPSTLIEGGKRGRDARAASPQHSSPCSSSIRERISRRKAPAKLALSYIQVRRQKVVFSLAGEFSKTRSTNRTEKKAS